MRISDASLSEWTCCYQIFFLSSYNISNPSFKLSLSMPIKSLSLGSNVLTLLINKNVCNSYGPGLPPERKKLYDKCYNTILNYQIRTRPLGALLVKGYVSTGHVFGRLYIERHPKPPSLETYPICTFDNNTKSTAKKDGYIL